MSRGTESNSSNRFLSPLVLRPILVLFVLWVAIPLLEAEEPIAVLALPGDGLEDARETANVFAQTAASALSEFGSFSPRIIAPEDLVGAADNTGTDDPVAAALDILDIHRLFAIEVRRVGQHYEIEVVMAAGPPPIRRTTTVFTARTEEDAIGKTEIVARGHARARTGNLEPASEGELDQATATRQGLKAGQAALQATIAGIRPALLLGGIASGSSTVSPVTGVRRGAGSTSITGSSEIGLAPGSSELRLSGVVSGIAKDRTAAGNASPAVAALPGSFSLRPESPPPGGVLMGLSHAPESNRTTASVRSAHGRAGDLAARTAEAVAVAAANDASRRIPGEILVSTEPRGVTVFADGKEVGTSPLLLREIHQDALVLEARSDALYAETKVTVQPGIRTVTLRLEPTFGRLFLSSDGVRIEDLVLEIDGTPRGRVGDGLVSDVPIGTRRVVLRSAEYFWAGSVEVPLGRVAEVDVEPVPIGQVRFSLPEGATAIVSPRSTVQSDALHSELQLPHELSGSGTIDAVPAGRYHVVVSGDRYISAEDVIEIRRGNSYSYSPQPDYTREYFERVTSTEIDQIESLLSSDAEIAADTIGRTVALVESIEDSPHTVPELEFRAKLALRDARDTLEKQRIEARLSQLRTRRSVLVREVEALSEQTRRTSRWRFVSLGGGIGSAGLWAIFTQAGNKAYTEYLTASVTEEAVRLRSAFQTWDALSYVAAGLGIVGIGAHVWLSLREPADREAALDLNGVEKEIEGLEGRL